MNPDENSPLLRRRHEENESVEEQPDDDELTGCGATPACNPYHRLHRYLVLIPICFLSFGSYFCYDNPAALQDKMKEDLHLTSSEFMTLYSLYSWPNVVLCFLGGFLIDKVLGIRLGSIIFSGIVTVGQIVFAFGALVGKFWIMQVGRFIYGLGGENLCVAQNTYAVNWFKGKELNMVFGLQLSFSRVGSTINMVTMIPLYMALSNHFTGHTTLGVSLFVAGLFCVASLLCAMGLGALDKRAHRILKKGEQGSGEVIHLRDVKKFPATFWLMSIICVTYYVTIFPFVDLGLVFFEMKYGMAPSSASVINSLVYVISAVACPFIGFVIDLTGKNIFWVICGVILTLLSHGMMAFTFWNPYIAMVVMGLAYSILASALWPMVALVIPEHQLGTAYGIMQSLQNLGLAVVSQLAGLLVDSRGYLLLEVFFLLWLCAALIASVVLYLLDAGQDGPLNISARRRRKAELILEIEVNDDE